MDTVISEQFKDWIRKAKISVDDWVEEVLAEDKHFLNFSEEHIEYHTERITSQIVGTALMHADLKGKKLRKEKEEKEVMARVFMSIYEDLKRKGEKPVMTLIHQQVEYHPQVIKVRDELCNLVIEEASGSALFKAIINKNSLLPACQGSVNLEKRSAMY